MRLTNFDGNSHNYCIPRKDFALSLTVDDLCYGNVVDKLGLYEDIDENPDHLAKVKKAFEIVKEILDDDLMDKLNANSRNIIKEILSRLPEEKLDILMECLKWPNKSLLKT